MDTTIDELRAGWEAVREKVKALQLTAQWYAERNQQLIDENRVLVKEHNILVAENRKLDELLWWVTALAWREGQFKIAAGAPTRTTLQRMLATQGYAREGLEKR